MVVLDLLTGSLEVMDLRPDGGLGQGMTRWGVLSANGSHAAFWSISTGLVAGDDDRYADVFVRARAPGLTELVSVSSDGIKGNHVSGIPSAIGGPAIAMSRD